MNQQTDFGSGDIHLQNVLVKPSSGLDRLSIEKFYDEYGKPQLIPVSRNDGRLLLSNIPSHAVLPLNLAKTAWDFTLADAQILLSDFGEAFDSINATNGEMCNTPPAMRPPETYFEPHKPLTNAADIWSLGVALWEIIGIKAIFSGEYGTGDEMISQQIDVLGPLPLDWFNKWEGKDRFFDSDQNPKKGPYRWPAVDEAFQEYIQKDRREESDMGSFSEEETTAALGLIRRMLVFKPEERLTIEEVLRSEWMVKWALPDLERAKNARINNQVQ